jgi:hypothetical protein
MEEAAEWRESRTHTCARNATPSPPPTCGPPEAARDIARASERARVATATFSAHLTDNAGSAAADNYSLPSHLPARAQPGIPRASPRFRRMAGEICPALPSLSYRELANAGFPMDRSIHPSRQPSSTPGRRELERIFREIFRAG